MRRRLWLLILSRTRAIISAGFLHPASTAIAQDEVHLLTRRGTNIETFPNCPDSQRFGAANEVGGWINITAKLTSRERGAMITLIAALVTQVAIAQPNAADPDEIHDPEVLLPAQPAPRESAPPCVIDAAAVQDPRINRDVLRVMQTNPYFANGSPQRLARYVEVMQSAQRTATWEYKFRRVGCGFYIRDARDTWKSSDGRYVSVEQSTALDGPGGELFSESKDTTRSTYSGDLKTEVNTYWSQLASLEVTGSRTPVAVGNRYGTREVTKQKFGDGYASSYECLVTERRPALDFHPRLTGDAFIQTCNSEYVDLKDHKRTVNTYTSVLFPDADRLPSFDPSKCRLEWHSASEFNPRLTGDAFLSRCKSGQSSSVWFPDLRFSFDPEKCRLELRGAAEFNRNLHGQALATRCRESSGIVFFPELEQWLIVDTIDGAFRADQDPTERRLLTEVELAQ